MVLIFLYLKNPLRIAQTYCNDPPSSPFVFSVELLTIRISSPGISRFGICFIIEIMLSKAH